MLVVLRAVSVVTALALTVTGCSADPGSSMDIEVSTAFHGDGSAKDTDPTITRISASPGEVATIDHAGDTVQITVDSTSESAVEISTDRRLAQRVDGGRDLRNLEDKFTVSTDSPLHISTPSLDGYTEYEVTLVP